MIKFVVAIVCLTSFFASNVYAAYEDDDDVAAINKDMPKPVKLFNLRQIECNHWAGEEPYDEARRTEINGAFTKLKCDALEKDEKKLLKKYKSRSDIIDSISKAKEFY